MIEFYIASKYPASIKMSKIATFAKAIIFWIKTLKNNNVYKYLLAIIAIGITTWSILGIMLAGFKVTRCILSEGRTESQIDGIDGMTFFFEAFPYIISALILNSLLFIHLLFCAFKSKQYKVAAIEFTTIIVWVMFAWLGSFDWTWDLCRHMQSHPDSIFTKLLEPLKLEPPKRVMRN